jgi:predicted RNA binding protein YcfA (HicA-like mRNA interferase family)
LGNSDDLPRVATQKELQALLEANGWTKTIGGKRNVKMEKPGERPITLPMHKGAKYGAGLTVGILRQAGLKGATAKES